MDTDDLTRIGDALHWLNAAQMQATRFLDSFASHSAQRNPRIEPDDWRRGSDSVDAHFLLVAMRHLAKALDRLPDALPVPPLSQGTRTATSLLRNILEHWDEQRASFSDPASRKEQSGKRFSDRFPEFSPWSFGWSNDPARGTRIGGAFHVEGVPGELRAIEAALVPLWSRALRDVGLIPYRGPAVDFDPPRAPMPSPEDVAVASFSGHAQAAVTLVEGAHAVVLAVADTDPGSDVDGCPWWITCAREHGGWTCSGGGNGFGGWHVIDNERGRGVAYLGGRAPEGRDTVEIRFRGISTKIPVHEGYFAWACFDALPGELAETVTSAA